ncbi:YoaK family protein [Gordonia sp. CPCC 205515]|uniref:YoaK family protein n=1 Tax=Gordonia sp. CPCC 205515 TaxID=3140791 RepID=UPI003AF36A83
MRFALLITCASGFLDSYTFLARGGVFANAQTGNVIFLALNLAQRHWAQALGHLWPILAFVVGVAVSMHIRAGRLDALLVHPIRVTMLLQTLILLVVGFVPTDAPHWIVTIPIAFIAAMQIELFRSIGGLNYVAVATTGNLMRLVEAGYSTLVDRAPEARRAFGVYGAVVGAFASGAVIGAFATHAMGGHAAWVPAGFLAITLVFFIIDQRKEELPAE